MKQSFGCIKATIKLAATNKKRQKQLLPLWLLSREL